MHIVVTGVGGFIGRHMGNVALIAGHSVTAYFGRSIKADAILNLPGDAKFFGGDLLDAPLPEKFDALIHCAASSPSPGTSPDFDHDNEAVTTRLARLAADAGCRLFIYMSSISVYGAITEAVLTEDHRLAATDPYGMTKLGGEEALAAAGVPSIALRLPAVVGPGAKRNWPSQVKAAARDPDSTIAIFNPDAPFNNALHVADLTAFCMHLLTFEGFDGHDAVNLAASGMTTIREAVRLVAPDVDVDVIGSLKPAFTISTERAEKLFGFAPMSIGETLRRYGLE